MPSELLKMDLSDLQFNILVSNCAIEFETKEMERTQRQAKARRR